MRKLCVTWGLAVLCVALWSSAALAGENPILASLTKQGVTIEKMNSVAMHQAKGTSLQNPTWSYLLYDSYTPGISRPLASLWLGVDRRGHIVHQVKYTGTGSTADYRSFRYFSYSMGKGDYGAIGVPIPNQPDYAYVYTVTGDEWLADMDYTKPQQWMLAGSVPKELHVIIVDPNTGAQYNVPGSTVDFYGWRVSYWNRPVGTFSW